MIKSIIGVAGLSAAATGLALTAGCSDMGAPRVAPPPPPPLAAARCADLDFPVYFQDGSDQLTPAARQVLAAAVTRVRGCTLRAGEIVGLAAAGPAIPADELSQRRAVRVAEALAAAGVPGPALQIKAAGDAGAVGPSGHAAPMRHAAQVFLHFARS
ncbi:MAG: OmpA family protein [Caulobacteraceae bacterium]|nr:OmpA family protein [Caulobacter sp.]